jgi:hypothetical protein
MERRERAMWIVAMSAIGTLLGLGIGGAIGMLLGGLALSILGFGESAWVVAPFLGLATGIGCSLVGLTLGLVVGIRISQNW